MKLNLNHNKELNGNFGTERYNYLNKNSVKRSNIRIDQKEIRKHENRRKERRKRKMNRTSETCGTLSWVPTYS